MTQHQIKDLVAGAALLALALAVHLVARGIEARIPMGIDSGFFPEVASALLGLLACVIILQALFGQRDEPAPDPEGQPAPRRNLRRVGATCLLIVAYGITVPRIGFALATLVYLPLQFVLLSDAGDRNWPVFAAVATVATGAIYAAFSYGFGLILPSGPF